MRLALLGLCVISVLQITSALQPSFNLDQLLETTDDEDIVWLLQKQGRAKRHVTPINTQIRRERRDTGSTAPDTGGGDGDGGAPIAFSDPVTGNDNEGSGGGSGEGPDDFST